MVATVPLEGVPSATADPARTNKTSPLGAPNILGIRVAASALSPMNLEVTQTLRTTTPMVHMISDSGKSIM